MFRRTGAPSMAQFGNATFAMTDQETDAVALKASDLPPQGRSALRVIGRWAAGLLIAAWCLFLLSWLALYGVLLPRVAAWKPEIEAQASRMVGARVRIGDIEVPAAGWVPALRLSEVVLLDDQDRPALRLPKVSAALSPRSLLSLDLRFEQLLIEGAALEVRRDAQGRLRVAGLALEAEAPAQEDVGFDATDWLLRQGEFAIRGAQIRWVDERRGAPALVLQDVDFVLRNSLRRHDWRLDATPPEGFGERWTVRGRFRQGLFNAPSDWRTWTGEIFAHLPETDVAAWRPHVDLPREVLQGKGATRVWVDIEKGQLKGATADVALRDVALRWPGVRQPMEFTELQGRMLARQDRQSVTLGLEQLSFTTGQGLVWPASDMRLVLKHDSSPARRTTAVAQPPAVPAERAASAEDGETPAGLPLFELFNERQIVGGEFTAARLDLALMTSIALRAPLGASVHEALASLSAQGRMEDMKATWEGPPDRPSRYRLGGRLADLQIEPGVVPARSPSSSRPMPGRPGFSGARVVIEATEAGGHADVDIAGGSLIFPGVFEEPRIGVDDLRGRVAWQWRAAGQELEVSLSQITVRNEDLTGQAQAIWRGRWADEAKGLGFLDLTASVDNARADRLWRYLPLAASADTRSYLRKAVTGGRLQDLSLRIKGELESFPFAMPGQKGEFKVGARWREGTLSYLPAEEGYPAWPEVSRLDAKLRYDGQRLDFSDARGRIFGVDLTRGAGRIDLMQDHVPLTLDVQARGPAQDLLRYVKATPIDQWLDQALGSATATGGASMALRLDLPLVGTDPGRVKGSVQLAGNDLQITPALPTLAGARGRVDFTEKGFAVTGASAQLLGGEVTLDGGLSGPSGLRLNLQGQVSAAALRQAPQLDWLLPLSSRLKGQTSYRLAFTNPDRQLSWTLTSPLTGLGVDLPAPLNKAPEANWSAAPLRVQVGPAGPSRSDAQRIEIHLGRVVQAQVVRQSQGDGRVLQAAVGIGVAEPPAMPAEGLALTVVQDRLDADGWLAQFGSESRSGAAASASTPTSSPLRSDLLPRSIQLRTRELWFLGRHLDEVVATITPAAPGWRADVSATQLRGRIDWRPGAAGQSDRVTARLSRLSIPATTAAQGAASPGAGIGDSVDDARLQWPALDVVADDFELRGRRLGRLEIEADVREAGRDWRLRRLNLQNADAMLSASGSWAPAARARVGDPRVTTLDLRLDLRNAGDLLAHMGYTEALKGGKGPVRGTLSWRGSPMTPDIRTMQGQLRLDVQDGQFLKADPGAARLLGVLSLQSLPRRLVLDFRDVFQEGFPFDTLDGDVDIQGGVARTRNLRMRGLQAAVLMDGSADILKETQEVRVLVIPEINAGTASLAYATINPVLGLGTFLAQLFLRRPLMAANTREFQISGSWTDPKVERVQRTTPLSAEDSDRAAAALSAPASAPTSPLPGPRP